MSEIRSPAPPSVSSSPAQVELLRRGLVRVSIAADGLSPVLDRRLGELRQALRADAPPHQLEDLLPDLEQAVLAADADRQDRLRAISQSLRNLARQLHKQDRTGDAAAALRELIKRLERPLTYLDGLPGLLDSLAAAHALSTGGGSGAADRGIWSRLFGGGGSVSLSASREIETDSEVPVSEVPVSDMPVSDGAVEQEPEEGETCAGQAEQYSVIAAHVETVLIGLLDELEVLESEQARHARVHQQVHQGLNWYELAAVLDEVSILVLSAQRSRQSEFERYLQQLNSRLAQFHGGLEQANKAFSGSLAGEVALEGAIRGQLNSLHEEVRDSTDLNALKASVETRLDGLLNNLEMARVLREQRDGEVAAHLKTMVERIQIMEVEAQTFRRHLDEQTRRAMLDNLTGLANRAGLQKRMDEEFDRWQRYGGILLLAVLDVDHFKTINDNFGHLAGDKVLRLIAQQLQRRLRKTDFIGRFGGEEFVLLMPGTSLEQGAVVLEALRGGIAECPFHFKSQRVPITISLGYTEVRTGDALDQVFDRADQAMYQAKRAGRNCIVQSP